MAQNIKKSIAGDLFIHSPFWNSRLKNLSHPVAIRMAQDLDDGAALGIGDGNLPFWKGFKHNHGQKDSNIDFLFRVKQQHPQKIILVQIGEFYESWGIDSVFLVEHCGINRMGRKGPRAGMPLSNIQAALDDLTKAGFCVVVCEQADDVSSKGRKIRFISEIITPSSPTYTYGLAMNRKVNAYFPEAPPEFGLAVNSKGVKLVEINPDLRTSLILEGLTEEAAIIRLNRYNGRMNRIFIHDQTPKNLIDAANLKFHNLVRVSGYSSREFPKRVEELIKIDLGLDANIAFLKTKPNALQTAPQALYQGTAEQVGILPKRGIPNLIELMLPKSSPATCQYIIRSLLLNPPASNVAQSLRSAIKQLQQSSEQLPILIVSNPVRYVKTLNKGEASPEILKDLFCLSEIFLACQQSLDQNFVNNALEIVSYLSAMQADQKLLNKVSKQIIKSLSPILPKDDDEVHIPQSELISKHLFEDIEEAFRGRISRTSNQAIASLYEKVESRAMKYEKILQSKLIPIIEAYKASKGANSKSVALSYDIHNKAIWLRGKLSADIIKQNRLIHPIDRYGKEVRDRWTVKEAEAALTAYKAAALDSCQAIKATLKELSQELAPHCLPIIHLATFSNLVKTLYLHIKECQPKDWGINFSYKEEHESRISVKDFFPYWMNSAQAVLNGIDFDGVCLLTGHNMAGKSTLIRSLAVTTLLGSVGFMFPAKEIRLSEAIDGWFVRTGAQDDPEAGLSAFGVEMTDIKIALRDASHKSFLLIDELGKGTESRAGHAIAASVLEHLAQRNIKSIFATHWHEIFANPAIELNHVKLMKMHCDGDVPTYKLQEGKDLNSSAFYTALQIGVDKQIVQRAQEIAQGYNSFKTSANFYAALDKSDDSDAIKQLLAKAANEDLSQVKNLQENQIPALNDMGCSIVYVLKTANNFFYVGETDNFLNRVKSHHTRLASNKCQFFYVPINKGKSQARKIEQKLITKMKNSGFAMLSVADATNLNFGKTF
ncbi:MAG: GIY-YIG nuclease family protein [Proteobacteria bacterium]|nr:GIY-YIG nuclease family protein [Pseudomonadota bacterium]